MRIAAFWKNSTKILLATLLVMAFSVSAFAQFEKGTISGTITDSQKAVITGATVTATSVDTSASRSTTSDNLGGYVISNLEPGTYEVKVSKTGFGDFKQKFTVSPGVKTSVNASLSAQATGETVEVIGTSETQVDTQTSSLNQIVDQTRVAELPSLTRDPYDFVQTLGNVNQDSSSGSGGIDQITRGTGVSFNGARSASTNILLDGAENVDLYTTKVGQVVPLDSVQEFTVTTNNYSAEYGRASGGVVNVVTKGGTNNLHGSLYEFNRVSALTSNDFDSNANGVPKAKYTRNQFGYSVGGPIKKDKLFFFSSTEWLRVRSAANTVLAIPDPGLIAASPSAFTKSYFNGFTLRPGLVTLQKLNATQANALPGAGSSAAYTAYAGSGAPVMDIVNYQTPFDSGGGIPQNTWYSSNKVDFNLSDKTTMFGRYSVFNSSAFAGSVNNSPYTGFDTGQQQLNQNFLYSLTHIWNSKIVTDSRINYSRIKLLQPLASQPIQPSMYFNISTEATVKGDLTCLPGYSCTTPGNSIPFGGPQHIAQFAQAVSINKGNHDLRFGGDYLYAQDNRTFGAYENAVEGLESGGTKGGLTQGLDNLMNANAGWFQVVIDPQGHFPCPKNASGALIVTPSCEITTPAVQPSFSRSNRYNEFALYGQDSWKIMPRLTLNLGLRWEYYGVQHNNHQNLDSNFVFGPGSTLVQKIQTGQVFSVGARPGSPASPVGGLWKASPHNFAPRVGFAWDVFGDGKTSLRGGYGLAYERNFGNVTFNVIQNPPAQFNSVFTGSGTVASPYIALAGLNNLGPFAGSGVVKPLPPPSLRYVRQDIPTSYTENWNLSVERQVLHNSLFALEYSGQRGIHLYSIENLNQQGAGVVYGGADVAATGNPFERLNLQYGNMNTRGSDGFSYYNALNTRFASSNLFHQGLNFTVNYTWSHTIDNLSSTFSETPQTENLGLLDPFIPSLDKGNADYDARHRVAISAVWDLPYAKETHGWVKQVLDGWQMDPIFIAHTGNPFTVFDSSNVFGGDVAVARYFIPAGTTIPFTGNTSTPTLDPVTGKPLPNNFTYITLGPASATYAETLTGSGELPTCNITTNAALDPVSTGQNCHFPANMTHRNAFRGPGAYFFNFAVRKSFQITERYGLQFSSEAYNLLNHSNYYVQSGGTQDMSNYDNAAGITTPNSPILAKRGVNPAAGVPNERRFIQFALRLNF